MRKMTGYPIDHLVLPTADLDVARARLTALGFTVAPVGVHPFGTINCCVYLASGAFLELLAIGDKAAAETAIGQGNVFVSRDATYRMLHGEEGFSALVFGTADAAADHRRFQQLRNFRRRHAGIFAAIYRCLPEFGRRRFQAGVCSRSQQEDIFFFTCQRVNTPYVDRSALERHPNGVVGLKNMVLGAGTPRQFKTLLERVASVDTVAARGSELKMAVENGTISVLDPSELQARYGIVDVGTDLRACAAVFAVSDLTAIERLLKSDAIAYERRDRRIIVPAAPGQGATFVFEDAK